MRLRVRAARPTGTRPAASQVTPAVAACGGGAANVASGRVDGTRIVVEWADVPMGNIMNGGGLTLAYDEENRRLTITERRGTGERFGATEFTRIEPTASPVASPSASASP
jgi:hypothetical protein